MPYPAAQRHPLVCRFYGRNHTISRVVLDLSFLSVEQRKDRSREFVSSLEEVEFENENKAEEGASQLLDEIASSSSRASY